MFEADRWWAHTDSQTPDPVHQEWLKILEEQVWRKKLQIEMFLSRVEASEKFSCNHNHCSFEITLYVTSFQNILWHLCLFSFSYIIKVKPRHHKAAIATVTSDQLLLPLWKGWWERGVNKTKTDKAIKKERVKMCESEIKSGAVKPVTRQKKTHIVFLQGERALHYRSHTHWIMDLKKRNAAVRGVEEGWKNKEQEKRV